MKRISYCGESFLTTSEGADALLSFVATCDNRHNSELVEMPAVQNDGRAVTVQMIVGSMSELISIPEGGRWEGPDTTDAVAQLRDRALLLSAQPGEDYSGDYAASAMEYGWDDIYSL